MNGFIFVCSEIGDLFKSYSEKEPVLIKYLAEELTIFSNNFDGNFILEEFNRK